MSWVGSGLRHLEKYFTEALNWGWNKKEEKLWRFLQVDSCRHSRPFSSWQYWHLRANNNLLWGFCDNRIVSSIRSLYPVITTKMPREIAKCPIRAKMLSSENHWDGGMTKCKGPKQQQAKEAWKMLMCLEGSDFRWEWDGRRSGCRQRPNHIQALQNMVKT